jgi:DNA repair protein RadA/Sms
VPLDTVIIGEVGLTGEVRQVSDTPSRLREAARHGFKRALLAKGEGRKPKAEGLRLELVASVEEAVALALEPSSRRAKGGA